MTTKGVDKRVRPWYDSPIRVMAAHQGHTDNETMNTDPTTTWYAILSLVGVLALTLMWISAR